MRNSEKTTDNKKEPSSFRDPSGFLFFRDGVLYRQINRSYQEDYDHLMESGLHDRLVGSGHLVAHSTVGVEPHDPEQAYNVIQPEMVSFISYPYEWCFSQLKDAALLTLDIQREALESGMSLKDCSAYNVQFKGGRPIFIDTLSFEQYREGEPWVAYRQFCQHFLAPLALISYNDIRLQKLLRMHLDGIPLDLASKLLPLRTYARFSLLSHIHFHARVQQRLARTTDGRGARSMSRTKVEAIVESLRSAITSLRWRPNGTEWAEYYEDTNYSSEAQQHKKDLVSQFLHSIRPQSVWDVGANTGLFSRIASNQGIDTIAFDIDPAAVEKNYRNMKSENELHLLPLVLDLTNPTPSLGWAGKERMSLRKRGPADVILALALVHHLAISNNIPLGHIAQYFHSMCSSLIIEFVPKGDSNVQRLLSTRKDIFLNYDEDGFERAFSSFFHIQQKENIHESKRILYMMTNRTQYNE